MQLYPPQAVLDIAEQLRRHGHEAWAVGGAVRDALLGNRHADWDLATDAHPEQVRGIFRRTVPIGIEHGTVGVLGRDGVLYEVTTFRLDVETHGRHATVAFARTLEEDLARRDFTINAIAWNPLTEELRDPYGGFADLQAALLRTVGDPAARFAEDYLRVLRGLRFAGHYVLAIEPATWQGLQAAVPRLDVLSAERVREELLKVLGKTRHASAALELYADAGALEQLYPELHALVGFTVPGAAGNDGGDAWRATLVAVDGLPPARLRVRLAALLHAVGMPGARTRDLRGGWRVTGHEAVGARLAGEVLRRLRASNAETEAVARLVGLQHDLFPPDANEAGVRRWLARTGTDVLNDLFRLRIALCRAYPQEGPAELGTRWRAARRVLRARPPLTVGELSIDGGDLKQLGLTPGPEFGEILRALLERVLDDPTLNDRERLLHLVRESLPE